MAAVYCTFVAVIRLKEIKTRALSKLGAKIFRKAVILSLDLFSMPYYDSKGRSLLRYLKRDEAGEAMLASKFARGWRTNFTLQRKVDYYHLRECRILD